MGTRLRLKASFNISTYPADDQVILTALKKYGMILADNGSAMFVSGVPDNRWNNTNLNLLKNIAASNFEVVQTGHDLHSRQCAHRPITHDQQFHSESNECRRPVRR